MCLVYAWFFEAVLARRLADDLACVRSENCLASAGARRMSQLISQDRD